MDKFLGRWEVTGTENMEEMLKSFDMEEDKRKIYSNMKFLMEYRREGDEWEYTVDMPHGVTKTFKFRIGEPYDSTTLDGRPILSCIKIDNGKFVEVHKDKENPQLNADMVREIVNGELVVTATVNGISSITRHKRL